MELCCRALGEEKPRESRIGLGQSCDRNVANVEVKG
jgi:hypothetical protein